MKKIFAAIMIPILLCITGCSYSTTEHSSVEASTNGIYEFPAYYEDKEGCMTFECEVKAPSTVTLYQTKATPIQINVEEVKKYFLDSNCTTEPMIYDDIDGNPYYYYDFENKVFSYGNKSFYYYDESAVGYMNALRIGDDYGSMMNGDEFKEHKDIDAFSGEQAVEQLDVQLKQWVPECGELSYSIYVCSQDLIVKEYLSDATGESYLPEHMEEGYYIAARQTLQGIPVFTLTGGVLYQDSDDNTPISAYVTEDGMGQVDVGDVFLFDETNQEIELLPFETIADNLEAYYNNLITPYTYTVYYAKLYNYVKATDNNQYEVVPVWIFKIREIQEGREEADIIQVEYNAVTGEVFER